MTSWLRPLVTNVISQSHFQSPLFALDTDRNFPSCIISDKEPPVLKLSVALGTAKAFLMPLRPQRLYHRLQDWSLALFTFPGEALCVAPNTPGISIFLHKSTRLIKRITALGAEKVTLMPGGPTCDNHFAFDGRLAGFTPRRKEFVEVKMAVEANAWRSGRGVWSGCKA